MREAAVHEAGHAGWPSTMAAPHSARTRRERPDTLPGGAPSRTSRRYALDAARVRRARGHAEEREAPGIGGHVVARVRRGSRAREISSAAGDPPWSRVSSSRVLHRTGRRGRRPTRRRARAAVRHPSKPPDRAASPGSSRRQFAGYRPDWATARVASTRSPKSGKVTLGRRRNVGRVLDPHPRLGDHAERALRAEEQPVG